VEDVSGALGRGGYEGHPERLRRQHLDRRGHRRREQARDHREDPEQLSSTDSCGATSDLHSGKLQVLQVLNDAGQPVTLESQTALCAPDQVALRTYGKSFDTRWVTIHDTAVDAPRRSTRNTAAKAAHGTPFKRPENGAFRPGTGFREFYFDETGDTNATSPENGGGRRERAPREVGRRLQAEAGGPLRERGKDLAALRRGMAVAGWTT